MNSMPRPSTTATAFWVVVALVLGAGACSEGADPAPPTPSTGGGAAGGGGSGGLGGGAGGDQRLPNGEPCAAPADCESNNCVDGVCCNGVCDAACEACDSPGSVGVCTPHAAATDPDAVCQGGVCDGAGECAIGSHQWSAGYGSSAQRQLAWDVALDNTGNVVVVGSFEGTVNFGAPGDELTSLGGQDIFVAKLAPDGSHLWSRSFGDAGEQVAVAVDVDVIGSIVVAGSFEGTVNFGGGGDELTSAGAEDVFMVRLDVDGNHVYSRGFGDAQPQTAHALVVTPCGDLALSGTFLGTVNFGGPGDELSAGGGPDIFVARFLPDGTHRWSQRFGEAGGTEAVRALAADVDGNVVMVGDFTGDIDFGGGLLTAQGGEDVFVVKLDPDGVHQWSKRFGDGDDQRAGAVAVDNFSDIIITGPFAGNVNFGGGGDELVSQGGVDLYLAKLGSDGSHLWSHSVGDAADQGGAQLGVAADWRRSVITTGTFAGAIDFGGNSLTSAGLGDVYVAKLAADGTPLWSQRFGDAADQAAAAVVVAPDRSIVVTGVYGGSVDFGGGALPTQSVEGVFVAKLAP